MKVGPKIPGRNASKRHEDLVDRIRWRAAEYLQSFGYALEIGGDFVMIPGDGGLASCGRWAARPDVWVVSKLLTYGSIAVEVGRTSEPDKWRGVCPMIHVSFLGGVALFDGCGGAFETDVVRAICCAVAPGEPDQRSPFWWLKQGAEDRS
jgi:hypothetical protein